MDQKVLGPIKTIHPPPKILEKLSPQKIYIPLQNSPAPLISGERVTP